MTIRNLSAASILSLAVLLLYTGAFAQGSRKVIMTGRLVKESFTISVDLGTQVKRDEEDYRIKYLLRGPGGHEIPTSVSRLSPAEIVGSKLVYLVPLNEGGEAATIEATLVKLESALEVDITGAHSFDLTVYRSLVNAEAQAASTRKELEALKDQVEGMGAKFVPSRVNLYEVWKSDDTIDLTFKTPTLSLLELEYVTNDGGSRKRQSSTYSTEHRFTVTGLTPNTNYQFTCYALGVDKSRTKVQVAYSDDSRLSVTTEGPIDKAQISMVAKASHNSVNVVPNTGGKGGFAKVEIQHWDEGLRRFVSVGQGKADLTNGIASGEPLKEYYTFDGLRAGTDYRIRFDFVSSKGKRSDTWEGQFTTLAPPIGLDFLGPISIVMNPIDGLKCSWKATGSAKKGQLVITETGDRRKLVDTRDAVFENGVFTVSIKDKKDLDSLYSSKRPLITLSIEAEGKQVIRELTVTYELPTKEQATAAENDKDIDKATREAIFRVIDSQSSSRSKFSWEDLIKIGVTWLFGRR